MVKFKDRLKELRVKQGLTQEMLAEKLNMGKSTIGMYENGKRLPSFEIEEEIADFFNVDLDYLRGRSNKNTSNASLVNSSMNAVEMYKELRADTIYTVREHKTYFETTEQAEKFISVYDKEIKKIMGVI